MKTRQERMTQIRVDYEREVRLFEQRAKYHPEYVSWLRFLLEDYLTKMVYAMNA